MISCRSFKALLACLCLLVLPVFAWAFGNPDQDAQKQNLVKQLRQETMEEVAREQEERPEGSYLRSRPVYDEQVRTPLWEGEKEPGGGTTPRKGAPSEGGSGGGRGPGLSGSGQTS